MLSVASPLAIQLGLVHRAVTTALAGVIESLSDAVAPAPTAAISTMCEFVHTVEAHHRMEDDLAFPEWRFLVPDAPYAVLAREHEAIVRFLNDVRRHIASIETEEGIEPSIADALETLRSISKVWHPHISIEERHFSAAAFNAVLGYNEQLLQATRLLQYSLSVFGDKEQAYAFLIANLSKADALSLAEVSGRRQEREA